MTRVLLVEDNRLVKIIHERMLTRAGYHVVSATDGEEALRQVRQFSPDIVFAGHAAAKNQWSRGPSRAKARRGNRTPPVIVLTGLSQKNEEKLRAGGAAAFLEKSRLLDGAGPVIELIELVLEQNASRKNTSTSSAMVLSWTVEEIESAEHAQVRF